MEFFNPNKLNFKFTKTFKLFLTISAFLAVVSLFLVFVKPQLNYGIDFRGGVETTLSFQDQSMSSEKLRGILSKKIENFEIKEVDSLGKAGAKEFFITVQATEDESLSVLLSNTLKDSLGASSAQTWTVSKLDSVGPKVGAELRKSALLAFIYTCLLIAIYIYWRFDLRYAPGALISITHDLIVTAGFLALTQVEFSTSVVAALLTLAGYSINDTVVVFDRIREMEIKFLGKKRSEVVDIAINSTLPRTIITSGTTLISAAVLFFVGGAALKSFSITLFFGILLGTYSSVFIASPLYLLGNRWFGGEAEDARTSAQKDERVKSELPEYIENTTGVKKKNQGKKKNSKSGVRV